MTGSVQIMKSSHEVRESFDVNAGVEANSKKFAFSASSSYSKVQNTPTIDTNPWLFSTKLVRISDLIRDSSRKLAMSQAIDDYLMRQYVTMELVRVLDTLPPTAQTYPEVADLRKRIDEMGKKYPLVESEVVALGDDVDYWYRMLLIRYDNSMGQYTTPNNYDGVLPYHRAGHIRMWVLGLEGVRDGGDRQWKFNVCDGE
nr:hypothetical protein BaRGS_013607 [Batillaria attramentaria]